MSLILIFQISLEYNNLINDIIYSAQKSKTSKYFVWCNKWNKVCKSIIQCKIINGLPRVREEGKWKIEKERERVAEKDRGREKIYWMSRGRKDLGTRKCKYKLVRRKREKERVGFGK